MNPEEYQAKVGKAQNKFFNLQGLVDLLCNHYFMWSEEGLKKNFGADFYVNSFEDIQAIVLAISAFASDIDEILSALSNVKICSALEVLS